MAPSISRSGASVSVSYGTVDAGLFFQEEREITYASLDRAAELVAKMPRKDRKALLEPIERELIDPQSVFYLIDDKTEGRVAISVEDFIHLASTCFIGENSGEPLSGYSSIEGR